MNENITDMGSEYLSIGTMLKARASAESGERFIYLEASREGADQQNEYVLAKALEDSAPHFLKFGNIDIDHKSMPVIAERYGIQDPENWEIGVPEDVSVNNGSVFVKARLFQGDSPLAARANMVWDSMTNLNPPKRWYASVGGATLAKAQGIDPLTKNKVNFVTKVRWSNLAISQQPVNQHVNAASTVPFEMLSKCWTSSGFDLTKALMASHSTDVASLSGGGALGVQSIDTGTGSVTSYFDFRDKLSDALNSGALHGGSMEAMIEFSCNKFGLSSVDASEWVDRFLDDLKNKISRRSKS